MDQMGLVVAELMGKYGKELAKAGIVLALGAFVGAGAMKVKDEKDFEVKAADVFEFGFEKGAKEVGKKFEKEVLYPMVANIALALYIAQADGDISRSERKPIDTMITALNNTPKLPRKIKTNFNEILEMENYSFESIKKYLEIIDVETLESMKPMLVKIAKASRGIDYNEKIALEVFERYLTNRKEGKVEQIVEDKEPNEYYKQFISKEDIAVAKQEYTLKMKSFDTMFKAKTKLNKKEMALLMTAVALQCVRIYLMNAMSKEETANHGEKENWLHEKQEKVLGWFKGDGKENETDYASLNEIITVRGVPYDATAYEEKGLGIFKGTNGKKGVNHRFATLGHDPVIGLVVGTVNIMTNTITTTQSTMWVPMTYHVIYDENLKNPKISTVASFTAAVAKAGERTKEDIKPLVAAVIKQLIHIATDMYTPAGLSIPGANLVLDRTTVEKLTQYVNSGDLVKLGVSYAIDELINKMIELIHGAMLLEDAEDLTKKINQVKTRKIVLYSNAIATGSNVVKSVITDRFDELDFAGLIVLLRKYFSDLNFIYDVKHEFIMSGLRKELLED